MRRCGPTAKTPLEGLQGSEQANVTHATMEAATVINSYLLQFSPRGYATEALQSSRLTRRRPPRSQTHPGTSACLAGGPCRIATFAGLSP